MAAQLTRLETRTKEFNMHASCWDLKPASAVKASHGFAVYLARSGHLAQVRPGASPPHHELSWLWWRLSMHVETRKMVNYAWAGRSQGKLWWRPVAILTCKSIV
jgi:hypothetical protein